MENLTGQQLGPFQIIASLGEGGMAAVYKAYQPGPDRTIALKVLPRQYATDLQLTQRFAQEARLIANLEHPNILPVYAVGQAQGYTYIAMRLVESGTLADLMHGQPLPLPQIQRLITQVASALDYAHSRGVIHRDIKPGNILVDSRGHCLLADFGLAKMVEGGPGLSASGTILGTPAYMSPEQCAGVPLDARSDVYSLGVVLFEMAVGRVPYRAETPMAIVIKHIQEPLPLPRAIRPDIPEQIELVILKALAKQPEDRFASAGELAQALSQAASSETAQVQADKTVAALPDATQIGGMDAITTPIPPRRVLPARTMRIAWAIATSGWGIGAVLSLAVKIVASDIGGAAIATLIALALGGLSTTGALRWAKQAKQWPQSVQIVGSVAVVWPVTAILAGAFIFLIGAFIVAAAMPPTTSPASNFTSDFSSGTIVALFLVLLVTGVGGLALGGGLAGFAIARALHCTQPALNFSRTMKIAGGWAAASVLLVVAAFLYAWPHLCGTLGWPLVFAVVGGIGNGIMLGQLEGIVEGEPEQKFSPLESWLGHIPLLIAIGVAAVFWISGWLLPVAAVDQTEPIRVAVLGIGLLLIGQFLGGNVIGAVTAWGLRRRGARVGLVQIAAILFAVPVSLLAGLVAGVAAGVPVLIALALFGPALSPTGIAGGVSILILSSAGIVIANAWVASGAASIILRWVDKSIERRPVRIIAAGWSLGSPLTLLLFAAPLSTQALTRFLSIRVLRVIAFTIGAILCGTLPGGGAMFFLLRAPAPAKEITPEEALRQKGQQRAWRVAGIAAASTLCLVLGLATGFGAGNYEAPPSSPIPTPTPQGYVPLQVELIILAAEDIQLGEVIRDDQVTLAPWRIDALPVLAITDSSQVIGAMALKDIPAGTPVLSTMITR